MHQETHSIRTGNSSENLICVLSGLFSTTEKTKTPTEVHIFTIRTLLGRQTLNNSLLFKHVIKFKSKCRMNGADMHGKAHRQSTKHTYFWRTEKDLRSVSIDSTMIAYSIKIICKDCKWFTINRLSYWTLTPQPLRPLHFCVFVFIIKPQKHTKSLF